MLPGSTKGGGQCMGMPDVCKTPTPGGPVPMPYPNIAMLNQAIAGTCSMKVMIVNMPVHTLKTQIAMTSGDEAGSIGGVVSGMIKGPAKYSQGSMKVMIEGAPGITLTMSTQHNGSNANAPAGMVQAPGQTKVMAG